MGGNVLSTNGPDWRRHRKVTSPAFDNRVCVARHFLLVSLTELMCPRQLYGRLAGDDGSIQANDEQSRMEVR